MELKEQPLPEVSLPLLKNILLIIEKQSDFWPVLLLLPLVRVFGGHHRMKHFPAHCGNWKRLSLARQLEP